MIYCRISQDREDGAAGIDRQEQDCLALAAEHGWNVIKVYRENNTSASAARRRPEFQAMLKHLATGTVGGLLFYHPDRAYRKLDDLVDLTSVCIKLKIQIHTVKAGRVDLSTATGIAVAEMSAVFAKLETARMGERIKRSKQQTAAEGRYRGGARPFGYKDGGMELEPHEADAIRTASTDLLSGTSLTRISRNWNDAGLRTARGGTWQATNLRKVLQRPRNAGLVEMDGNIIGPAAWPAIVTEDQLRAVTSLLSDPSRRTTTTYERKHMGRGIFLCGKCGASMRVFKLKTPTYRCVDQPHLSIQKSLADSVVSNVIIAAFNEQGVQNLIRRSAYPAVDVDALTAERADVSAKIDERTDMFDNGEMTRDSYRKSTARFRERLTAIERELASATVPEQLEDADQFDDFRDYWESISPDRQGKIIDRLLTVTILPVGSGAQTSAAKIERIQIEWKDQPTSA